MVLCDIFTGHVAALGGTAAVNCFFFVVVVVLSFDWSRGRDFRKHRLDAK